MLSGSLRMQQRCPISSPAGSLPRPCAAGWRLCSVLNVPSCSSAWTDAFFTSCLPVLSSFTLEWWFSSADPVLS